MQNPSLCYCIFTLYRDGATLQTFVTQFIAHKEVYNIGNAQYVLTSTLSYKYGTQLLKHYIEGHQVDLQSSEVAWQQGGAILKRQISFNNRKKRDKCICRDLSQISSLSIFQNLILSWFDMIPCAAKLLGEPVPLKPAQAEGAGLPAPPRRWAGGGRCWSRWRWRGSPEPCVLRSLLAVGVFVACLCSRGAAGRGAVERFPARVVRGVVLRL